MMATRKPSRGDKRRAEAWLMTTRWAVRRFICGVSQGVVMVGLARKDAMDFWMSLMSVKSFFSKFGNIQIK
jgi:hypothetical protein